MCVCKLTLKSGLAAQNLSKLNDELSAFRTKELDTVRVLAEMKQRISVLDLEKQNALGKRVLLQL